MVQFDQRPHFLQQETWKAKETEEDERELGRRMQGGGASVWRVGQINKIDRRNTLDGSRRKLLAYRQSALY